MPQVTVKVCSQSGVLEGEDGMSDKEKYICKECDMNCELKATTHFEEDWPKICPFGVLLTGGYEHEPKWLRRKRQ